MHQAETRALRRAVVVLVLVSVVRWGWASRGTSPRPAARPVLAELAAESREAADEEARRAAPLDENERIDPNRADEIELDRLPGVGPATARAIVAARDEGVVFRRPEDLLEVRGIGPATLARLRDRLALSTPSVSGRDGVPAGGRVRRAAGRSLAEPTSPVDVNSADLRSLETLPGIGPALAERILVARREQVFTSLEDLTRVKGIGPATVERLRGRATAGGSTR